MYSVTADCVQRLTLTQLHTHTHSHPTLLYHSRHVLRVQSDISPTLTLSTLTQRQIAYQTMRGHTNIQGGTVEYETCTHRTLYCVQTRSQPEIADGADGGRSADTLHAVAEPGITVLGEGRVSRRSKIVSPTSKIKLGVYARDWLPIKKKAYLPPQQLPHWTMRCTDISAPVRALYKVVLAWRGSTQPETGWTWHCCT